MSPRLTLRTVTIALAVAASGCSQGAGPVFDQVMPETAVLNDSLAPAIVVARAPSISDVVALVLRERPTAAELEPRLASAASLRRLSRKDGGATSGHLSWSGSSSPKTHGWTRAQRASSEPGASCR
ncbi:MAG: hypothetical protein ACSLFK_13400 [Gemmatimonadaceae bacterium]